MCITCLLRQEIYSALAWNTRLALLLVSSVQLRQSSDFQVIHNVCLRTMKVISSFLCLWRKMRVFSNCRWSFWEKLAQSVSGEQLNLFLYCPICISYLPICKKIRIFQTNFKNYFKYLLLKSYILIGVLINKNYTILSTWFSLSTYLKLGVNSTKCFCVKFHSCL